MRWSSYALPIAILLVAGPTAGLALLGQDKLTNRTPRFQVQLAPELAKQPQQGRLLVVLGKPDRREPRFSMGQSGLEAAPLLGMDVTNFQGDAVATLDDKLLVFPIERLDKLPRGEYLAQPVLITNRDLYLPNAPGNLYGKPQPFTHDPAQGGDCQLTLSERIPDERVPEDTEFIKHLKFPSKLLSAFHGRPFHLRASILLPKDHGKDAQQRYPLRVHVGGYGTRYTALGRRMQSSGFRNLWMAEDTPRFVMLHLDGAGPHGDPYQVNSANNGPYGDALTQELIPFVEEKYGCVGKPHARVLDGGSTGGWVSLALQIFYPDYFNGCWSHCPDPVDFRAFELINAYSDNNAYVNRFGFERPAKRTLQGDVVYTVRHECLVERVLGRGGNWTLSGRDWGAWNAVFSPRGKDGLPQPLWDGATGLIDRQAAEHWKKYDLRHVLEQNWATLAPKLQGKIRIHVGAADDYYLNNAVTLLERFTNKALPPFDGRIVIVPNAGHTTFLGEKETLEEMAQAVRR